MTRKRSPSPLVRVAYQGQPGSYSELASQTVFPDLARLPCPTFEATFAAVEEKLADLALIPVENVIAGRVAEVHFLLRDRNLFIVGEHFQPIRHQLLGIQGAQTRKLLQVLSHPQALSQCSRFILKNHLQPVVWLDTAAAAAEVAKRRDPTVAAIASAIAGKTHGLRALADNIADRKDNVTRFIVLSRSPHVPDGRRGKFLTSLLLRIRHRPGALHHALGVFASRKINIVKMESYLLEGKFISAGFYMEIEGHPQQPAVAEALATLQKLSDGPLRLLGTYARAPERG